MTSKKNKPLRLFQLIQSKKSLLVLLGFLTIFFGCIYIEDDTPTLSYSVGAGEVPFAEQFEAEPVVKEGYTLDSFELEYTVVSRPADGVESIYALTNIQGSKHEPSIDSDTGVITFPAGFRVGYELEVQVTAMVVGIPQSRFRVGGQEIGDEVIQTLTYRVVDNGLDSDGDGVATAWTWI